MAIDPSTIVWDDEPQRPQLARGQLSAGNIDLTKRPVVRNADGSISTVRSISANFDGREYLIPTVSDDGRILSDDDAIDLFRRTGRNLGAFDTPENATAYAESLHNDQARMYDRPDPSTIVWDDEPAGGDQALNIDIVGGTRESDVGRGGIPNPTDNMSGIDRFRAGVGKSLVDTYQGLKQAAGDVGSSPLLALQQGTVGALSGGGFLESGLVALSKLGAERKRLRDEEAARREIDRPLLDTGAGFSGNVLGTIAQILGPGVAARGTTAANALLPTTVRGNALQGLTIGALQPVASENERVGNALLGGVGGGAGALAAKGAGAALNTGRNLLARTGLNATDRQAGNVLAREATNPNNLTITQSDVPGVQRTLGEASGDSGLMALENLMRARNRGAFEPIDLRNNAARVQQLQNIAGTEGDMAAAEAARESVVDTALQRAMAEGRQFESSLEQANRSLTPSQRLQGEDVSEGLRNLRLMASRMSSEYAPRPSVQSAINDVGRALDSAGESVGSLYLVRQYIGDLLQGKAGADKSYARAASRELMQLREALDSELANRAPSFPEYLSAYRNASKPINRMEVGREILSRSSSTAQDQLGNPILTPSGVSRSTNDLDAIAAKATDFKKARATDILTAYDLASLRAIQDDMQRIAQRSRSATAGSQTAERLSIGERAAVRGVGSRLPWVGPLFEHFEQQANQRLSERLAYLMANPSEAQRVLAALPKEDAGVVRKSLNQLALAAGRSAQPSAD
ncbi:hypothetical protein [Stenotrophomonas hibiscicola]|uniref:hypothetical protein n=1 Tax=Stenotrophomonas hibiscicola TaxID=86189 RepID=UPI00037FD4CB|nr:hypothetical protein [[Pseudomonas] hibiscicola]